jgi:hypothetical protein
VFFEVLDTVGVLVLVVLAVTAVLFVRMTMLRRNGATINCAFRLREARPGRGWRFGVVRYTPRHLQWFRTFSPAPHPKFTLSRRSFEITGRREPRGFELHAIPHTAVVVQCVANDRGGRPLAFELAMGATTMTGFLAWLESAPPGAHHHRDARRG